MIFLLLTLLYPEFFYFGFFISIAFALVFIVFYYGKDGVSEVIRKFISFIVSYAFIIPMSLVYFIPLLDSGVFITSSSSLLTSINNFSTFSEPIINLIILKGYEPNLAWLSASLFGKNYFLIWEILEFTLITFLILIALLLKSKKYKVILLFLLTAFLLGSGLESPLANLNIILYEKFPGYPVLNTSYWWEWVIIAPLYSATLAYILNDLTKNSFKKIFWPNDRLTMKSTGKHVSKKNRKPNNIIAMCLVSFVVIVLLMPIITQGYYGGYDGIREKEDHFILFTFEKKRNKYQKSN